jgi:energy-converting hydrogenase A subunit D
MIELLTLLFSAIAVLGAVATLLQNNPFDKLISLGMLSAGVIPFIVDRGYLDVAIAFALIVPVSTLFILLVCRREVA